VLVAKQVAEADLLSNGRIRLGVGVGWNRIEYRALNQDFGVRGRLVDEQIAVMRQLWTKEVVTFKGKWHDVSKSGMNPMPVQRPIPIWMGGSADASLRRIARSGDGWCLPQELRGERPSDEAHERFERLRSYARDLGRDPAEIGVEAVIPYGSGDADAWGRAAEEWQAFGASHLFLDVFARGRVAEEFLTPPAEYMERARRLHEAVASAVKR
jgi:probable F420-dependent oxidoreductase